MVCDCLLCLWCLCFGILLVIVLMCLLVCGVGDLLVVRGLWAYLLLCLFCLFVFANALGLVLNDLLWLLGGFVYFGCLLR